MGVATLLGDYLMQLDSDYVAWREAVASALEIGLKELPVGLPAMSSMPPGKVRMNQGSTTGLRMYHARWQSTS